MKKVLIVAVIVIISIPIAIYISLYYQASPQSVKSELQTFINSQTAKAYTIKKIEHYHSPDLFHQVIGYSIILTDVNNIEMERIYIRHNEVSNEWDTFRGSSLKTIKPEED